MRVDNGFTRRYSYRGTFGEEVGLTLMWTASSATRGASAPEVRSSKDLMDFSRGVLAAVLKEALDMEHDERLSIPDAVLTDIHTDILRLQLWNYTRRRENNPADVMLADATRGARDAIHRLRLRPQGLSDIRRWPGVKPSLMLHHGE